MPERLEMFYSHWNTWNIWGMYPALAIAPCGYDISLYYHIIVATSIWFFPACRDRGLEEVSDRTCATLRVTSLVLSSQTVSHSHLCSQDPFTKSLGRWPRQDWRIHTYDLCNILLKENLGLTLLSLNSIMPEWTRCSVTIKCLLVHCFPFPCAH